MPSKKITFKIDAEDKASQKFNKLQGNLDGTDKKSSMLSGSFSKLKMAALATTAAVGGLAVVLAKDALKASIQMENALIGLSTVARAFGEDQDLAKKAAMELASDGLMSVNEAAEGLKNLIPRLGLERSIELMNGFKDSAAFNRQGTLAFGQAIVGATQGIKNMNSILVDNAGITKNLSVIMSEAGYTMQDLDDDTKGAAAANAMYSGLLEEMTIFQGDAERAADTLGGKLSQLSTAFFMLKVKIGDELAPVVLPFIESLTSLIENTETLKEKFTALFAETTILGAFIRDVFGPIVVDLKETFQQAWEDILEAIEPIKPELKFLAKFFGVIFLGALIVATKFFAEFVKAVVNGVTFLIDTFATAWNLLEKGVTAVVMAMTGDFEGAWDSIKEGAEDMVNYVIRQINKLIRGINEIPGVDIGEIGKVDFRADGGPVTQNSPYMVGERGPEMFVPNQSGTIVPNGSGTTFNFTFNGDISDKNDLINTIKNSINRELELSRYGIA